MKERPILFSGPMVRAILEGRKTMTRRVFKGPSEINNFQAAYPAADGSWIFWDKDFPDGKEVTLKNYQSGGFDCPYGQPGDRLWVRETWAAPLYCEDQPPSTTGGHGLPFWYRADGSCNFTGARTGGPAFMNRGKWRPSIHMPRWASRINLEITGVKVERLCDICANDCLAEGINGNEAIDFGTDDTFGDQATPEMCFHALWDHINGNRPGCSWDDNPFVWVVSFRRQD